MKKNIVKKVTVYLMTSMLVCSSVPGTVEAHSGRTDSSGGHHDNKNVSGLGSYHYHCGGNPPHLHGGGVCPYSSNANTATVNTSSSVSGGGNETTASSAAASVTASTTSSPSNVIKLSDNTSITISKDIIKIVQDILNQKGYNCGAVDGSAGNKTREALKKCLSENKGSNDTDHIFLELVAEAIGVTE